MGQLRKTALVTGAAGFVGRVMTGRLLDADYDVTGIGIEAQPSDWYPGAGWIRVDLKQPEGLAAVERSWDCVVHLAGLTVPGSFDGVNAALDNVAMTLNLLDHLSAGRVLIVSSALVYGPSREPHSETEAVAPQGYYGLSKHLCEQLVAAYRSRLDIVIARPFNHLGTNMPPGLAIPSILRRVTEAVDHERPIEMQGQNSIRDFIDVRDVVAAYFALIEHDQLDHDVYNVSTGIGTSIADVVRMALDVAGLQREVVFADSAMSSDDTSTLIGDPFRLKAATGWAPRFELRQSLESMLNVT